MLNNNLILWELSECNETKNKFCGTDPDSEIQQPIPVGPHKTPQKPLQDLYWRNLALVN